MPHDNNLYLYGTASAAGSAVTADGQSTAIEVTGGDFALVHVYNGAAPADADETIAITVQASTDGTNYGTIGKFPTFEKTARKGTIGTWVAIPVYIPRAEANPDGRGVDTKTKVRLDFDVAGTTPSWSGLRAWLAPLNNQPRGSVAGFTSGNAGRYGPLDALQYWAT